MERQRLPVIASLMAIGSGIVWSFGASLKRLSEDVDAFQYLIWRSIGIIVVIEILSALKAPAVPHDPRVAQRPVMMLANFGLFLASIAFVYAVDTTTAANAAFLGSLTPLVAVVFTRFLGERLSKSTIIAIAVGIVGLVLTVFGDLDAGNMLGNASALLASVGSPSTRSCLRSDPHSRLVAGALRLRPADDRGVQHRHGRPRQAAGAAGDDIARALLHGAVIIVVGTLMFNAAIKACAGGADDRVRPGRDGLRAHLGLPDPRRGTGPLAILGGAIIFAAVIGKAVYDTAAGSRTSLTTAPDVPLL